MVNHATGVGIKSAVSVSHSDESPLNDGVYAVPMDVLQIISKNFSQLQSDFEKEEEQERQRLNGNVPPSPSNFNHSYNW